MSEPPILPPRDDQRHVDPPLPENRVDASLESEGDANPYAATLSSPVETAPANSLDLPPRFWAALAILIPLLVLACYFAPGLGIPGLMALVAAVIRVPLIQQRHVRGQLASTLPKPLVLLLTSWLIVLAFGFTACIAFCIICIPSGFVLLSLDSSMSGQGFGIPVVFGLSGLIGLGVFIMLFIWSLKWSV